MDLSNLYGAHPLSAFTKEQKRSCILMWVALNMKLRLKGYNLPKAPTGYSTRLWGVGRGVDRASKGFMENRVQEHIKLNALSADDEESLKEVITDLSQEIIDHALVICQDLLRAARNAKTDSVRNKYYKAINNPEYLRVVFIISVSNYAKELITLGIDINHIFLTLRLSAMEIYKKQLNQIWIDFAESDKNEEDYLEATQKTDAIFDEYERGTIVTTDDLDKLADERLIYKIMGQDNIDTLIDITVDGLRESVTNEIRLINVTDFRLPKSEFFNQ